MIHIGVKSAKGKVFLVGNCSVREEIEDSILVSTH